MSIDTEAKMDLLQPHLSWVAEDCGCLLVRRDPPGSEFFVLETGKPLSFNTLSDLFKTDQYVKMTELVWEACNDGIPPGADPVWQPFSYLQGCAGWVATTGFQVGPNNKTPWLIPLQGGMGGSLIPLERLPFT